MKNVFVNILAALGGIYLIQIIGGVLIIVALFTAGTTTYSSSYSDFSSILDSGGLTEEVVSKGSANEKIRLIEVEGVISDHSDYASQPSMVESFQGQLTRALADDATKAILVRIKSPGGEVTASDKMYEALKSAADKKPTLVYLDGIAASGGYYLACGAPYIVASPTTITGSIGVIIQSPKYQDLLGKIGVEMRVYKSGPHKDILSGSRNMTETEDSIIQNMVEESYVRFINIVSESRGLDEATLRGYVADGRVYSGTTAKELKVVDSLGYQEDAINKLKEIANIPNAQVIKHFHKPSINDYLSLFGAKFTGKTEVNVNLSGVSSNLKAGIPYYLSPLHISEF